MTERESPPSIAWNPNMEEAPKDRRVLLWYEGLLRFSCTVGYWAGPYWYSREISQNLGLGFLRTTQPTRWAAIKPPSNSTQGIDRG